jgi:transposase
MARTLVFPELSGEQLVELQRILRSRTTPAGLQRRAQLIWELAAGAPLMEAAEWVDLHYTNAHLWVKRFLDSGIAGLSDRPKGGRPRQYDEESTTEIIKVASARPKDLGLKFTTWSLQKLEEHLRKKPGLKQVTRSTIRRRLQAEGFKFKAGRTWCESNDPDFEVKKTKL